MKTMKKIAFSVLSLFLVFQLLTIIGHVDHVEASKTTAKFVLDGGSGRGGFAGGSGIGGGANGAMNTNIPSSSSSTTKSGSGTGGNSPNFVVTQKGDAIAIPQGATGPVNVINKSGNVTGQAYTGGQGGTNKQVESVRIMNPTPANGGSPGYPGGYVKYENKGQQGVDPNTGRTVSHSQSHIPLSY